MAKGVRMLYRLKNTTMFLLMLCFVAGCFSYAEAVEISDEQRDSRWAVPMQLEGLPNLFQVTPNIYRSAQPDETGMRNAEKMGIKTVLSLRSTNRDPDLSEGTGLKLVRVPIDTWNISYDEIVTALRIINNTPRPILVHCRHGADRTGLIIAFYRMVFQGWSKDEATDELRNGGYGFHTIWRNIPRKIRDADINDIKARVHAGMPPLRAE